MSKKEWNGVNPRPLKSTWSPQAADIWPSISCMYPRSVVGGAGADPSGRRSTGRNHLGQVASQSQSSHVTDNHSHASPINTYGVILQSPIKQTWDVFGIRMPRGKQELMTICGSERPQLAVNLCKSYILYIIYIYIFSFFLWMNFPLWMNVLASVTMSSLITLSIVSLN